MKKMFKILGFLLVGIILALGCLAAWVGFSDLPEYPVQNLDIKLPSDSISLARGRGIVENTCAHCHRGEDGKLSGRLFLPETEGFGEIWSGNLTRHPTLGLGRYQDGEIAYLLRTGIKRDKKMAGPFMMYPNLSDEDVAAIIAYLRSDAPSVQASAVKRVSKYSFLAKALIKFGAFKPLTYNNQPVLAPPKSDLVAYGRYLATAVYECSSCHSANFETYAVLEPEKSPGFFAGGNKIADHEFNYTTSRNITPHPEQGIGKWTETQFQMAVRAGIRPDGTILSVAMPRIPLSDEELSAIWAYLQTVPALETTVEK
ncbi:MAG: cytochrome c [Saprospiraceae bacterium]|nr:cytochrome c [Saprospiraceae bacterium]